MAALGLISRIGLFHFAGPAAAGLGCEGRSSTEPPTPSLSNGSRPPDRSAALGTGRQPGSRARSAPPRAEEAVRGAAAAGGTGRRWRSLPARSRAVRARSAALLPPSPLRRATVTHKHSPHLLAPAAPLSPRPPTYKSASHSAPPSPCSGLSWPVHSPGPGRRQRRAAAAEEGAAERRMPEPTGGREGGGRCGGVGLERGVTQLTGAVRSRVAGAEREPAGSSTKQRQQTAVRGVGKGRLWRGDSSTPS